MSGKENIKTLLGSRVMVLDGAMGTMILKHYPVEEDLWGDQFRGGHMKLKGNFDLLSLTRPDIIRDMHITYLQAGADIITTNTFNANAVSQEMYGTEGHVYEMNRVSAEAARSVADEYSGLTSEKPRFVAGSIGPTNAFTSRAPYPGKAGCRIIEYDTLRDACREQAKGLLEGGVDLILLETIFDLNNARAALEAVNELGREKGESTCMMISASTHDISGREIKIIDILPILQKFPYIEVLSLGYNCGRGITGMLPLMKELSAEVNCFTSLYPGAGIPDHAGKYPDSLEEFRNGMEKFLDQQLVNIIGGCCGTTPEHTAMLADLVREASPRSVSFR